MREEMERQGPLQLVFMSVCQTLISSEYDMESLYSSIDGTSSSARRPGLKPRPSREAVPKKGILKSKLFISQVS